MCEICGQNDCEMYLEGAVPVLDDTPPSERMYRCRSEISENGHLLYATGHLIPLQEAILRGLPGALEQATAHPVSPENRDALPGGTRAA